MNANDECINQVLLRGRLAHVARPVPLPSGDEIVPFRVVVDRPDSDGSRAKVDAVECVARTARTRKSVSAWSRGDVVEVAGEIRRRFFTFRGATQSRVEILAGRTKRIHKAP